MNSKNYCPKKLIICVVMCILSAVLLLFAGIGIGYGMQSELASED